LAFLLPVLAALAGLEWQTARLPTTYGAKQASFERSLDRVETLALGNSHAYFGLDPDMLPGWAFNLALPGQPLRLDLELLERYLPRLPRLRRVVLGVSYHSYGYDLADGVEAWRLAFYERYFGIPAPDPAWSPRHHSWIALYGDPHRAGAAWLDALDGAAERFDEHGKLLSRPRKLQPIDVAHARDLVRDLDAGYREAHARENLAGWRHMLGSLQARGVACTLVTLPVEARFARAADRARLQAMRAASADLAGATGARYLDYFEAPGYATSDFYDVDHLAPAGAAKLTRALARELAP
jgi:hypothetical protein